jgi:hypothetical protein
MKNIVGKWISSWHRSLNNQWNLCSAISCSPKSKVLPLIAIQTLRGRKGIAPTPSLPQHYMVISVTPRPRFTHRTHWIGGWVGLRADLDREAKGKIVCLCQGSTPGVQSVVGHYTDWATTAAYVVLTNKNIPSVGQEQTLHNHCAWYRIK